MYIDQRFADRNVPRPTTDQRRHRGVQGLDLLSPEMLEGARQRGASTPASEALAVALEPDLDAAVQRPPSGVHRAQDCRLPGLLANNVCANHNLKAVAAQNLFRLVRAGRFAVIEQALGEAADAIGVDVHGRQPT
jgi:hypothetical protein